ncbi:hypothetical protein [Streptomyces sp. NBC_01013]|uniref:hypothetical protein n=1 Tax=Streptomyces sp. NBC_01013 TaxID=2903718 RepID=UPI00386D82EC|nr:hypothetical protein OG538_26235 [Streptomyces sp. NBC_01013]
MWQGQQSPPGQPNPQDTYVSSAPEPPRRPWNRTAVTAVAASAAVVVACGVTGFLVLRDDGGDGKDRADTKSSASASASPDGTARSAADGGSGPLVPGWNTVVNAKRGITFDVPASWARQSADWVSYVAKDDDPEEKPLVAMMAPAVFKEKWCTSDDDKNGTEENTSLASTGTTGEKGAKSAAEAAEDTARTWVYGAYTQPDTTRLTIGEPESYRTRSGVEGSLVTVTSSGTPKKGKCDTAGKAVTFAFKNAEGKFVSWTYVGAHGVPDEVSDSTIRQILGTVRLFKEGDGQD